MHQYIDSSQTGVWSWRAFANLLPCGQNETLRMRSAPSPSLINREAPRFANFTRECQKIWLLCSAQCCLWSHQLSVNVLSLDTEDEICFADYIFLWRSIWVLIWGPCQQKHYVVGKWRCWLAAKKELDLGNDGRPVGCSGSLLSIINWTGKGNLGEAEQKKECGIVALHASGKRRPFRWMMETHLDGLQWLKSDSLLMTCP